MSICPRCGQTGVCRQPNGRPADPHRTRRGVPDLRAARTVQLTAAGRALTDRLPGETAGQWADRHGLRIDRMPWVA